jgi:hypothetical protein
MAKGSLWLFHRLFFRITKARQGKYARRQPGRFNFSFTNWDQKQQAGEDRPRRLIERRNRMHTTHLVFLSLMIVILVVEVKIVIKVIFRKR